MLTLVDYNEIITWSFGFITIVAACYYFYLAFLKGRKRQSSLIELLLLVLIIVLTILPINKIDLTSGSSLAGVALLVYLITRIFLFFR